MSYTSSTKKLTDEKPRFVYKPRSSEAILKHLAKKAPWEQHRDALRRGEIPRKGPKSKGASRDR
jgi:hypothetical protein